MSATLGLTHSMNAWRIVGRGVAIESLRRKDAYVLAILMGCFVVGMGVVKLVGVENAATGNMLLNLGLAFAYGAAHLLTLLAAARQVPDEIEKRTVYPLLAQPLRRRDYVLGKWLATSLGGTVAYLSFMAMVCVGGIFLPQRGGLSIGLLAQMMTLHGISIGCLAALALAGSLVLPKSVNVMLFALLFFAGDKAIGLARARTLGGSLEGFVRWLTAYVPNFSYLNLINRYTDGVAMTPLAEYGGLVFHGAIVTAVALLIAVQVFKRRPL